MVQLKLLQLIVDLQEGKNSLIKMGFSFQFLLNQNSMFESSDCIHKLHQKSCPFFFFFFGGFCRFCEKKGLVCASNKEDRGKERLKYNY